MTGKRPTTVIEYIEGAPIEAQPHLRNVYSILKNVAPDAEVVIKWGNPFFVEPRFLFAFSAHKAHLSFAPGLAAMEAFKQELAAQTTTKHFLKISYNKPVPETLIRNMAGFCVKKLSEREDQGFW